MGFYQVSSNNSPGVKFDPIPGVTSFTWDYIGKTLEISLYLVILPKLTKFCLHHYLVNVYQECPNYSLGVKFGPTTEVTSFTRAYMEKTLKISLYLDIKPRGYQILHVALSNGHSPRGVNYNPRVELIAKGYKFYMA